MTTDTVNLPPLPEPEDGINYGSGEVPMWTEAQMRSYALLAVQEERRKNAEICEAIGRGYDNEWNRKTGVAEDLRQVAKDCASAIRSQKT